MLFYIISIILFFIIIGLALIMSGYIEIEKVKELPEVTPENEVLNDDDNVKSTKNCIFLNIYLYSNLFRLG